MSKDFQVTVNDASTTTYLDDDGKPVAPPKELKKAAKGGTTNADQT